MFFLAGDPELIGVGAGFVVLVSEGFDEPLEAVCGEDIEIDVAEGDDPEVILVLCEAELSSLVEVFPIEEDRAVGDNGLEELEGAHVDLSLVCGD